MIDFEPMRIRKYPLAKGCDNFAALTLDTQNRHFLPTMENEYVVVRIDADTGRFACRVPIRQL